MLATYNSMVVEEYALDEETEDPKEYAL